MSKHSNRKLENHVFTSRSNDEEEVDERNVKGKMVAGSQKNDQSKPSVPVNLERDHFLNAFLDHDMNQKEPLRKPVPSPRSIMKNVGNPVPSPRVRRAPPRYLENENLVEPNVGESKVSKIGNKELKSPESPSQRHLSKEYKTDVPSEKFDRMSSDKQYSSKVAEENFRNKLSNGLQHSQKIQVDNRGTQRKLNLIEGSKYNATMDMSQEDREIHKKFFKPEEKVLKTSNMAVNKLESPSNQHKFDNINKFDRDHELDPNNVSPSSLTKSKNVPSYRSPEERGADYVRGNSNSQFNEKRFKLKVDTEEHSIKSNETHQNVKSPRFSQHLEKASKQNKLEGIPNENSHVFLSETRQEMTQKQFNEKRTLVGVDGEHQIFDKQHKLKVDTNKKEVYENLPFREHSTKTNDEKLDSKTSNIRSLQSKIDPSNGHLTKSKIDPSKGNPFKKDDKMISETNIKYDGNSLSEKERIKDKYNLTKIENSVKLEGKTVKRSVMQRQNAETRDWEHSMDTRTNEVVDDLFDAESKRVDQRLSRGKDHAKISNDQHKENESKSVVKPGPMKATLPLNQAKKKHLNEPVSTKKINTSKSTGTMKKSHSFTNISNIKPASPRVLSPGSDGERTPKLDSVALREQIYFDWLTRKNSFSKASSIEQKKSKMEEREKTELESKEKRVSAQKAFDAWNEKKTEVLKYKVKDSKKQKDLEKEKLDEKLQRKLDSKKYFESWKQRKDEELKDLHKQKNRNDKDLKKKEFNEKVERVTDAKKTFDNWKARKDESILEKKREERKQREKEKEIEMDKLERKQQASRSYETWKEKRGKSPRPSSATLMQRPWCPSNRNAQNCIPADVKPVIHRTAPPTRMRTMSATARLQGGATKRSK